MKRRMFVLIALISSLFCCPACAQDSTNMKMDINKTQTEAATEANETDECDEPYKIYTESIENLTPEFADLIANGTPKEMYCIASNVNVREEPNLNSHIFGRLQRNTTVEAIATDGEWICITTQGGIAFVYGKYLKEPMQISDDADNRWGITLTDEEYELVARIGMLECGGEEDLGQQAVFEVIFNRVYHDKYPDNVIDVLSQKGQFVTWKNRNIKRATPTEKIYKNLNLVLAGQTNILPYETVYFSLGAQNSRVQEVIGCHVFCNY